MKTNKLLAALIFVSVVLITGCEKDKFVPTVGICPEVISTIPSDIAINAPLNQVISATFNEAMNPATINTLSFIITGSTTVAGTKVVTPVTGIISYSGKTATFIPSSPLGLNMSYTCKIKTLASDFEGNALNIDHVWSFSTGKPPTLTTSDPAKDAVGVVLNKVITATFSESMDPLTLTSASFFVKQGTTDVAGTVTRTGTTVTFTPSAPFAPNTVYTVTITSAASNLTGISLANDYLWNFSTGISPVVTSTDPAKDAVGVILNKVVAATFSMPMDPATISGTTFILKQGTTSIPGTVTYTGSTASFTPAATLTPNTIYSGTITTGAKNVAGISLMSDFVWTFTTVVAIPPTVASTDPGNTVSNVALNKVVAATFSVPMNPATITSATFTLKQGTTLIPGTVTYTGSTASFKPSSPLALNTVYTGTITTGAKNVAGTALASDYIWTFSTGVAVPPTVVSTDPGNSVSGVALNKAVAVTFSVPMDPLTITSSTFTLKQGTTSVAGVLTYTGSTASFKPGSALKPNTVYTATITTGAKNLAGTSLADNYVWTFTTVPPVSPTVIFASPADQAEYVVLNQVISVTFSTSMNPLTITTSSFTLKTGSVSVPGTVNKGGTNANFTPSVNLLPNTTYTATITTVAKDEAGTPLAKDYVWSFTTESIVTGMVFNLKSAGQFMIPTGLGISNNSGFSVINNMNAGIYPGVRSSISGFPPATVIMKDTNTINKP